MASSSGAAGGAPDAGWLWARVSAAAAVAGRDLSEFVTTLQSDTQHVVGDVLAGKPLADVVATTVGGDAGGAASPSAGARAAAAPQGGDSAGLMTTTASAAAAAHAAPSSAALARLRALNPDDESDLQWGEDDGDGGDGATSAPGAAAAEVAGRPAGAVDAETGSGAGAGLSSDAAAAAASDGGTAPGDGIRSVSR